MQIKMRINAMKTMIARLVVDNGANVREGPTNYKHDSRIHSFFETQTHEFVRQSSVFDRSNTRNWILKYQRKKSSKVSCNLFMLLVHGLV